MRSGCSRATGAQPVQGQQTWAWAAGSGDVSAAAGADADARKQHGVTRLSRRAAYRSTAPEITSGDSVDIARGSGSNTGPADALGHRVRLRMSGQQNKSRVGSQASTADNL